MTPRWIRRLVSHSLWGIASSPLSRAIGVSLANQATWSLMNFGIAFYLVQRFSASDFGIYNVGIAVGLFASGLVTASLISHFVLKYPDLTAEQRRTWSAKILNAIWVLAAVSSGITAMAAIALNGTVASGVKQPWFGLAVALVASALVLRDYLTRYCFCIGEERAAATMSITAAVAAAGSFGIVGTVTDDMTPTNALICYAISVFAGGVIGIRLSHHSAMRISLASFCESVRDSTREGRWPAALHATSALQGQAHIYIGAIFGGTTAVGYISATRLLIAPALLVIPSVQQIILPRLAVYRAQGRHAVESFSSRVTVALLVFAGIYVVGLLSGLDVVVKSFLGQGYAQDSAVYWLTVGWSVFLCATVARGGASQIYQVYFRFRELWKLSAISALATALIGSLLALAVGPTGIVVAVAIGEAALAVSLRMGPIARIGTAG